MPSPRKEKIAALAAEYEQKGMNSMIAYENARADYLLERRAYWKRERERKSLRKAKKTQAVKDRRKLLLFYASQGVQLPANVEMGYADPAPLSYKCECRVRGDYGWPWEIWTDKSKYGFDIYLRRSTMALKPFAFDLLVQFNGQLMQSEDLDLLKKHNQKLWIQVQGFINARILPRIKQVPEIAV